MVRKKRSFRWVAIVLGAVVVLVGAGWYWQSQPGSGYTVEMGFPPLEQAYHEGQSGFMSEVSGTVVRILVDEKSDTGNQQFFIRLENGQTLLVVHDQEAAGRVPVSIDDRVTVRGEYTWSETGGILKNTVRDLSPRRRHGFIEHKDKRYH
jgi:hypothetical protein